jgi:hypothetical protein
VSGCGFKLGTIALPSCATMRLAEVDQQRLVDALQGRTQVVDAPSDRLSVS